MELLNYAISYDLAGKWAFLIVYYFLTKVVLCLYYKGNYIEKWFLGILPFASIFLHGQLVALPVWYKILYIITGFLSLGAPIPCFIIWRGLVYYKDYTTSKALFDNPWKYTLIPFYRYYWLIMELLASSREVTD